MVIDKEAWADAMNELSELPKEKRDHFAVLLINLANCYRKDSTSKAFIIVDIADEAMVSFALNADEMEAAEMVFKAYEVMGDILTNDAPDKEMFN